MRVLSVEISNFLSIERAHVTFDDAGLLLIEGYNYDVDRANGAGKTAILNALAFGLYDRLPRKITASEILRRGTKSGHVKVTVECGNQTLVVERFRPKGCKFYCRQGEELIELVLTQEEWERKLRLTYNQFIVSMYCSQANSAASPRFLLLNDTDKKQFLLQLLNLEEFSLCKKRADENVQRLLAECSHAHTQVTVAQSKIDALSEALLDEDTVQLEMASLTDSRQALLLALKQQETVPRPDLAKFQKLEDDVLAKKSEFTRLRAQREMLRTQWDTLGRKMRPFNAAEACPTCGTELDNTHARSVHEAEMARLQGERQVIKQQMDTIDSSLMGEAKISELGVKIRDRKRQESAEFERANLMRVDLNAKIRSVDSSIDILTKKLNDNAALSARVASLREKQVQLQAQVAQLSEEVEVQKTVASIYSPTGAQAYVLDSAVGLFNERIAKYVGILWGNLTYELQSYKENVRGEVTAKFSESIVMDGRPISLGSLSGGELRALSICTDMALLDLLEQQFGIHMSPIIFDEAFDGLDAGGKEFALELIKELALDRQVVVIDHASEMRAAFDKVIRVEKRNGVSSVISST
jgi:DNA repair exonuclease SbcCD ATPase subunit